MTHGSGDARKQPLYFLITTAGNDTQSVCYEVHQKALDILEGRKIDPAFYPAVFGIEEKDDWHDEAVWRRVNPSIGVTIPYETVRAAYEQAIENPAEEMHFRQFRLNEWCNADVRWMPMDKWSKCGDDFDEAELEGRECYCGLDLSSTTDLTSFVMVFPPVGNVNEYERSSYSSSQDEQVVNGKITGCSSEKYTVLPFFWLPEDVIEIRSRRDHVPYAVWKKARLFNTTEGNIVDYDYIVAFIAKQAARFKIREIAYDRYGAEKIRRDLEELGAENGFSVFPFGQGFISMSPASKDFYQFVMEGRIRHGKHPVLDWNIGNVIIDEDPAGNIKPNKRKSTEKIDGAIALIMGLARAALKDVSVVGSVYDREERGILWL